MTTYLKDLIQFLGRYVDSHDMKLGLRVLYAQVVSLLGADFWLAKILSNDPMLEDL